MIDIQKALKQRRQRARQAVSDFVRGAASGDLSLMSKSFAALDYGTFDGGGWVRAMRATSRLTSVPPATQAYFLQVYLQFGDHIRQECNDLVLADGLRALLPKYRGGAVRVYRGETFRNRSRRTYGLSWSASAEVARSFAEDWFQRTCVGGSVTLETIAEPAAIICAPGLLDDRFAEQEYIVDRRYLANVKVIERFAQLSHEKFRARGAM